MVNLAKPSLLCEKLIWFRDNVDNTIEQYTQDTYRSLIEKYVKSIILIVSKNNWCIQLVRNSSVYLLLYSSVGYFYLYLEVQ